MVIMQHEQTISRVVALMLAELHLHAGLRLKDIEAARHFELALDSARKVLLELDFGQRAVYWADSLVRAAVMHYRARNWEGADVLARLGIERENPPPDVWFTCTPFLWLAGEEEFRQVCRGLLDSPPKVFEKKQSENEASTVRLCGLDPSTFGEPERVLRLALRAIDSAPDDPPPAPYHIALGRAYYRAGKYELAVKSLDTAIENHGDRSEALVSLDLAIAHYLGGEPEEAAKWLQKATDLIDDYESRDFIGDGPGYAPEVLEIEVLRREAEQLILGTRESAVVPQKKDVLSNDDNEPSNAIPSPHTED
jgi:tetratricopeptide (TPR) repeat protein